MSVIAADRPIPSLKGTLPLSILMHVVIAGLLIGNAYLRRGGENWGGPGGAVSIGVVGSIPAIPMPRPEVESPNRVVDESKGLYKTEPAPEIKAPPPPDAVPITKFKLLKPPEKYVTRPSKTLENTTPAPPNAVPYGGGGTPTVPYTSFAMGTGTAQGGMAFSGAGGGDFGSRFPWYVEAVQRRISGNWLQSTIDPSVSVAPRVTVTFDILRDGTITNIQITHSSGNYSVDNSAVRAIRDSSGGNPLPAGYSGTRVGVEFWFDFHR